MDFESRHDIRAKTNMRPKLITDPGCQTCEFDLNFEEPKFEPKYKFDPSELSSQEIEEINAELTALNYDPDSCTGEECWKDFPDQTDNGMRTVSSDAQAIEEGIFDRFKSNKRSYTIKADLESLCIVGYCNEFEPRSFAREMRDIITRYRVEDLEEAAPISNSFGMHPAFRFKTTPAIMDKIEKQLESAFSDFLEELADKHPNGEAGRILGVNNPNHKTNIRNTVRDVIKSGNSGDYMDKNIYFASV